MAIYRLEWFCHQLFPYFTIMMACRAQETLVGQKEQLTPTNKNQGQSPLEEYVAPVISVGSIAHVLGTNNRLQLMLLGQQREKVNMLQV